MNKFSEFIDALLLDTYRYPITFWRVLLAPQSIFEEPPKFTPCPPGLCFFYTTALGYFFVQIPTLVAKEDLPKWFTPELMLPVVVVCAAILINIQRIVIGKILEPSVKIEEQIKLLFYPFSLFFLICLVFAMITMAFRGHPSGSLFPLLGLVAHLMYIYSLYNVLKHAFGGSRRKVLMATAGAYSIIFLLCVGIPLILIFALTYGG